MYKSMHFLICTVVAAVVMFASIASAAAQSVDEIVPNFPTDPPADTEFVTDRATNLDLVDLQIQTANEKVEEQKTDKNIPNAEDGGEQQQKKLPIFLPLVVLTSGLEEVVASSTQAYWRTIRYEGFEGVWPGSGWETHDCNDIGGEWYWNDTNWINYSGSWSGWPAGGGQNSLDPNYNYYPNNACSWMIYGPFSLSNAIAGNLSFKYWNQSELNFDYFSWLVSCDGYNFTGVETSGDSAGWRHVNLDLNKCLGDPSVWIGFNFRSDSTITDDGSFVDDIYIQEYR